MVVRGIFETRNGVIYRGLFGNGRFYYAELEPEGGRYRVTQQFAHTLHRFGPGKDARFVSMAGERFIPELSELLHASSQELERAIADALHHPRPETPDENAPTIAMIQLLQKGAPDARVVDALPPNAGYARFDPVPIRTANAYLEPAA